MRINIQLLLPSLTLLLLAACAGKEPPPTSQLITHQENLKTEPTRARLVVPATKVVGKANDIRVREIRTQTVGSRLLVDFTLLNDRGRRDVINYRLRWLDANGMTIGQYDPWDTVAMEGHEQSVLSATAPSPAATDFRLEIRVNQ